MEVEALPLPCPNLFVVFQAPTNLLHPGGGKLLQIPHLKQLGLHLAPPRRPPCMHAFMPQERKRGGILWGVRD